MKHIDREELFHSLHARVAYLQDFLNFKQDDVEALAASRPYVNTAIPDVVDKVYAKLLEHDVTARVFFSRDSRRNSDPDEWPTLSGPEISRRKIFLRWYLQKLNSDPNAKGYWEYLDKVASMHVGRHRHAPVNVDYIFLGACLGYVHGILLQAVFSLDNIDVSVRLAIAQAWGKIIWIQNDFFARWQILEATPGISVDELEGSQTSEPVSCPFSGDGSVTDKSSGDDEPADTFSRTASAAPSVTGSTAARKQPVASYKLMHVSPRPGGCPRLTREVEELIGRANVVHSEELNDGSRELLASKVCLEALRDAIERSASGSLVDVNLDYNVWDHSPDNEAYFGFEAAQLHESWTISRLQRLASLPGLVGRYYGQLLERRSQREMASTNHSKLTRSRTELSANFWS